MANKFTKSVLERQAKEAKQPKTTAPEKTELQKPAEKKEPPVIIPAKEPAPLEISEKQSPIDLESLIGKSNSRKAKNKTFYLDTAVIEAIHKTAKSKNINDSKLVNDILKVILQVD